MNKMKNKISCMAALAWLLFFCNSMIGCNSATETDKNTVPVTAIQDTVTHFSQKPFVYDSSKQYIYLTFDDGPQNGTTAVLELCKQLGVKASFFMVGGHAVTKNLQGIVDNIRNGYPQVLLCNHSFTHANGHYKFFYHHPEMALQDFLKTQQYLNVPYKIIRLPGNSAWVLKNEIKASGLVKPVCNLLDSAGYNTIGWDVEWSFKHRNAHPVQSPEKMIAIVDSALTKNKTRTNNHIVILSHDRMFQLPNYTDSLAKFITLLKRNPNYVFETVDHYPGLKPLR